MRKAAFPDTIFLPERAELALNCLTRCLNPAKGGLPYCLIDLTGEPPKMRHSQFDYSDHTARVIDAILLAQAMTGARRGERELESLEALFWPGFGADGLHYTPDNPWSFRHANTHYQRSVLNALLALMLARGSARAAEQARALAKGLADISIKRDGFWYFPAVERMPDGWPRGDWGILGFGTDPANTNGRLLYGLARLYEELADPNALALMRAWSAHVMDHSSAYLPDGSFATGMEFREGHFHSRALTMLGVIRAGHALGDARAVAWGRRVFDRALGYGSSFGWFPERLVKSRAHGCETCAIVDMMEAAIWLAKSGHAECWEHAERFLRNHLLESQLTEIGWASRAEGTPADEWETTADVAERALGGFAGWSQPNDLVSKVMHGWDLYMCCCAQGVRGLFNAWTHAVDRKPGELRVNLLINHLGEHATVRSWLPHEGRIEVTPAADGRVALRAPSWAERRLLTACLGEEKLALDASEPHYLRTRPLAGGETVTFAFPVREASLRETVLDVEYRLDWLGDTVMAMAPVGPRAPLYRRSRFPSGGVPLLERAAPVARFRL